MAGKNKEPQNLGEFVAVIIGNMTFFKRETVPIRVLFGALNRRVDSEYFSNRTYQSGDRTFTDCRGYGDTRRPTDKEVSDVAVTDFQDYLPEPYRIERTETAEGQDTSFNVVNGKIGEESSLTLEESGSDLTTMEGCRAAADERAQRL
jgi:hypothetical protein